MKVKQLSLVIAVSSLALLLSGTVIASNANCNSTFFAADGSYYAASNSDKIEVIAHAEPDLPPVALAPTPKKKPKSSTSFFSWITKSHTMPSLHFIEFIELFGNDEES
ncbi:MAG: hypothetical protein HWE16_11375 [Gammaproteobacteria bacterium]|nr:hypothetical protein [Gammaproteobacteria bacterium]